MMPAVVPHQRARRPDATERRTCSFRHRARRLSFRLPYV